MPYLTTVGGPIFTTPETVIEAMRRVDTDIDNLNGEVLANLQRMTAQAVTAWGAFRLEWQAFYTENQSEWSMLVKGTGTVMRETQDFSARLIQWRAAIKAVPGISLVTPGPLVLKDPSTPPSTPSAAAGWMRLVDSVAVLSGVLLLGYVAVVYVPKFLPAGKS